MINEFISKMIRMISVVGLLPDFFVNRGVLVADKPDEATDIACLLILGVFLSSSDTAKMTTGHQSTVDQVLIKYKGMILIV